MKSNKIEEQNELNIRIFTEAVVMRHYCTKIANMIEPKSERERVEYDISQMVSYAKEVIKSINTFWTTINELDKKFPKNEDVT